MSPESPDPVELPFQAAYDRLQRVAEELGADETMAPERLIALLREGKGLERALREHLAHVEQEIRDIDGPDAAATFRIVDAPAASSGPATPAAPTPAAEAREAPVAPAPWEADAAPATPEPDAPPPANPSIPFGDDIPF